MKRIIVYTILFFSINCCSAKNFVQKLWDQNDKMYQKIIEMPFNKELAKGTLDEEKFKRYIIQDYLYLKNYYRIYDILLTKTKDPTIIGFLNRARNSVNKEMNRVHNKFFKKFKIEEKDVDNVEMNPNTELYYSFLVKTAILEPIEVTLTATLPCWLIYPKLGREIKNTTMTKNNKYDFWIDEYGDSGWNGRSTKMVIAIVNSLAKITTDENRKKMEYVYKMTTKVEYMFWDGAYNDVKWIE